MDFNATMQEPAAELIDRRPIATRNRKWAQASARWLAAKNVSPNPISIAGMLACIAARIALAATLIAYHRIEWLIAALGVQWRLSGRRFLSNQGEQHIVGNHAQCLANVAEKLWPPTCLAVCAGNYSEKEPFLSFFPKAGAVGTVPCRHSNTASACWSRKQTSRSCRAVLLELLRLCRHIGGFHNRCPSNS